jgi:putative tryptophan/tyrosine transport system substrate-binding protein
MRDQNGAEDMKTKITVLILCAMFFALCSSAESQQPTKIPRIGYLATPSLFAEAARVEALRQGLRELGYAEGKNIVIDWRSAEGKLDSLPAVAAELVRLKVDVIVTAGGISTRAVKEATTTIPIVMTNDPDPVADGFVASLARPGGNITGLSALAPELGGKRLEILTEVVPKLSRVAVLGASTGPGSGRQLRDLEPAAKAFKVQLQFLAVGDAKDIEPAFQGASQGRAQAVLTLASPILSFQRTQIVELAAKNRVPGMYHQGRFVEAGGLMYYGVNLLDLDRRAAIYVDRILKGAKPADLPVEQPRKFELVINLTAAKQIGLTIPPNVLARADEVLR